MFPMQLIPGLVKPVPSQAELKRVSETRAAKLSSLTLSELRRRAGSAKKKPQKRKTSTNQLVRDASVVAYVKKAAEGVCDLCEQQSPFTNKQGHPYLECHHVIRLADDGDDAIDNAVALCPNCHRKMHVLNLSTDRAAQQQRIAARGGT